MSILKVVEKIDQTLDQLIRNAEVISEAQFTDLSEEELIAFQKTQESLMHHLIQMDESLIQVNRTASYKLHEKRARFEELKQGYSQQLTNTLEQKPIVSKRRGKKFFDFNGRKTKSYLPKKVI